MNQKASSELKCNCNLKLKLVPHFCKRKIKLTPRLKKKEKHEEVLAVRGGEEGVGKLSQNINCERSL